MFQLNINMLPHSPEIPSIIPFTDILLHNNRDNVEHKIQNMSFERKENFVYISVLLPPPPSQVWASCKNSCFLATGPYHVLVLLYV